MYFMISAKVVVLLCEDRRQGQFSKYKKIQYKNMLVMYVP